MYLAERCEKQALELAQKAIRAAAPGILSVPQVVEALSADMKSGRVTVRRYVRLNVASGELIELTPDRKWRVTWPEAERAEIGTIWLNGQMYFVDARHEASRLILASEFHPGHTRYDQPMGRTYLTTREHARQFINEVRRLRKKAPASTARS